MQADGITDTIGARHGIGAFFVGIKVTWHPRLTIIGVNPHPACRRAGDGILAAAQIDGEHVDVIGMIVDKTCPGFIDGGIEQPEAVINGLDQAFDAERTGCRTGADDFAIGIPVITCRIETIARRGAGKTTRVLAGILVMAAQVVRRQIGGMRSSSSSKLGIGTHGRQANLRTAQVGLTQRGTFLIDGSARDACTEIRIPAARFLFLRERRVGYHSNRPASGAY
jgi:hypothetical protein